MQSILEDEETRVDGLLGAGHVCSVMGLSAYRMMCKSYKIPIVITGFEVVDLLQGILMVIAQLESKIGKVENQYSRVVPEEGNPIARKSIENVFEVYDKEWRGFGILPNSGWRLKPALSRYDATKKFDLPTEVSKDNNDCIAGSVLKGISKPTDCPHFGKNCTPLNPIGAPMVSSEGACAAYFHYSMDNQD